MGNVDDGERGIKKKKRKRFEKKKIKVTKASSIHDELDHQIWVYEIATGVGNSCVVDAANLSNSTTLPPHPPLSTPAIVVVTTYLSTSSTTEATTDESVTYSEAPQADTA